MAAPSRLSNEVSFADLASAGNAAPAPVSNDAYAVVDSDLDAEGEDDIGFAAGQTFFGVPSPAPIQVRCAAPCLKLTN